MWIRVRPVCYEEEGLHSLFRSVDGVSSVGGITPCHSGGYETSRVISRVSRRKELQKVAERRYGLTSALVKGEVGDSTDWAHRKTMIWLYVPR